MIDPPSSGCDSIQVQILDHADQRVLNEGDGNRSITLQAFDSSGSRLQVMSVTADQGVANFKQFKLTRAGGVSLRATMTNSFGTEITVSSPSFVVAASFPDPLETTWEILPNDKGRPEADLVTIEQLNALFYANQSSIDGPYPTVRFRASLKDRFGNVVNGLPVSIKVLGLRNDYALMAPTQSGSDGTVTGYLSAPFLSEDTVPTSFPHRPFWPYASRVTLRFEDPASHSDIFAINLQSPQKRFRGPIPLVSTSSFSSLITNSVPIPRVSLGDAPLPDHQNHNAALASNHGSGQNVLTQ